MNPIPTTTRAFLDDSAELLDQAMVKIRHCLDQLSETDIWWRPFPEANSIGNLVLHLGGNLRQWIVAGVGGQADVRQREEEFSDQRRESRQQLLERLADHIAATQSLLKELTETDLTRRYSIQGFDVSGLQAINHSVTHFVGHTHQIILMTRLILGDQYQFAWTPDGGRDQVPI